MARQARRISKSGMYYIVLKGNTLFITDLDKERFTEIAQEKLEGGEVYGIHFDKDEIRMAVKEGYNGISMNMKAITTVYARYFNKANGREGKLFEGRFKSEPIETSGELEDYISSLAVPKAPKRKPSASPKRTKKAETPPVQEKPIEEKKQAPKKNLPSWLL